MSRDFEPKTAMENDFIDYDSVDPKMLEMQAALYKHIVLETLIGRADDRMGEYWDAVGKIVPNKVETPTKLPPKICNYRKPKVYWFGEAGNNVGFSIGTGAAHFAVFGDTVEGLQGRRFIGISEATEQHWDMVDYDFLHKLTGDVWVETRTLKGPFVWEPQGEIFIGGSKPLKINDKDKDTLEQVERIQYRVV